MSEVQPPEQPPEEEAAEQETEETTAPEGELDRIPPEEWVPHPASDYVDWMDKPDVLDWSEATEEQKEAVRQLTAEDEAAQAERDEAYAANSEGGQPEE